MRTHNFLEITSARGLELSTVNRNIGFEIRILIEAPFVLVGDWQ